MTRYRAVAIDIGAGSGRVMLGAWDGERVTLHEISRFPNDPLTVNGHLRWDIDRQLGHVVEGIRAAAAAGPIDSVGIDTWGVDYGLIDANGQLLDQPFHYRDRRTAPWVDRTYATIPEAEMYAVTGTQTMPFNTVFQLMADGDRLAAANRLLHMPDLIRHMLTGDQRSEHTIVSTSELLDATRGDWAWELIDRLGLPGRIFGKIVPPGAAGAPLRPELGLDPAPLVMPVAGHDTASAVVAVPATGDDFAYISSGTWSLVGVELAAPVLTGAARAANLSNEGGAFGTTRLLTNVMGLWLLEECRRSWQAAGHHLDYPRLLAAAAAAEPFRSLIDPNDVRFLPPDDMPQRIVAACQESGQPAPETPGQFARCIFESLALAYRRVISQIEAVTGRAIRTIYIVGGGSRNAMLSQLTADATGRPVICGPVEATALGNVLMQLHGAGLLADRSAIREVSRRSANVTGYAPAGAPDRWRAAENRSVGAAGPVR